MDSGGGQFYISIQLPYSPCLPKNITNLNIAVFGRTFWSFLKLPIFIHLYYLPIAYEPSGQNPWTESSIAGLSFNSLWFGSISFPFYESFLQKPHGPKRQGAAISEIQEHAILKEESVSKDMVHLLSVTMGCRGQLLHGTTMLSS